MNNPDADYEDINYLLSSEYLNCYLLENYPGEYLGLLKSSIRNNIDIKEQIHNKDHHSWYSNHLICLYYLVGDLRSEHDGNFYGQNSKIDETLAINIMNALFTLGINIYDTNFYEENIMNLIENEENGIYYLTSRINNEKFKKELKKMIRFKKCPGSP